MLATLDDDLAELIEDGRALGEQRAVAEAEWLEHLARITVMLANAGERTAEDSRRAFAMDTPNQDGVLGADLHRTFLIIKGAENIDPAVAENLLYKHPAVMECAVIGMKDEKYGEEVAAAVTRKPGVETTEEELLAYMNGNMKPFHAPKRIFFFDALPKTGLGKILKREIRRIIHEPK